MTEINNKHVFIGGPSDGVEAAIVVDGMPKAVESVRRNGVLYRFNGVVNRNGYREMMCEEVG